MRNNELWIAENLAGMASELWFQKFSFEIRLGMCTTYRPMLISELKSSHHHPG